MTRWYPLDPPPEDFFERATEIHRYEVHLDVPTSVIWDSLASDASVSAWSPAVERVTWLDPRPHGVGTTREVALARGLVTVRERFTRWDEGRGYTFHAYEAGFPILAHFGEDYRLTPDGDGTRFVWTVAIEPKPKFRLLTAPLRPVNQFVFGRLAKDGRTYFAGHRPS